MFKINDKVRIKKYQRTRTIYQNAEYTPGKTTTYTGGWTGTVTAILDDGQGGDIVEVHRDECGDRGYCDFSPDELRKLPPIEILQTTTKHR